MKNLIGLVSFTSLSHLRRAAVPQRDALDNGILFLSLLHVLVLNDSSAS